MPMYFPDLKSVQQLALDMAKNKGKKKYVGIHPVNEQELPYARVALGRYMREVWDSEIGALEVELALTEDNYHDKMGDHIRKSNPWLTTILKDVKQSTPPVTN